MLRPAPALNAEGRRVGGRRLYRSREITLRPTISKYGPFGHADSRRPYVAYQRIGATCASSALPSPIDGIRQIC